MRYKLRHFSRLGSLVYREHRDKLFGSRFQPHNKPWMRYREIEVVQEILQRLQPVNCLEWGAGFSTLFYPRLLAENACWLSVEHEAAWSERIRAAKPSQVARIQHVAPNQFPWTDPEQDGSESDLQDYLSYPEQFAPFDFILVDGRARNACVKQAHVLLKPEGVVVMHDANRPLYWREFGLFANQCHLHGYRTNAGGLWLASKQRPIATILDVDFHQTVWRLCRLTGGMKIKC